MHAPSGPAEKKRCLLLVTTLSYRTDAFLAAARALGVEAVIGSDRCHALAEQFPDEAFRGAFDGSIAVDLRDPAAGARVVEQAGRARRFDAIVGTCDRTAVVAAAAARALGLLGNDPDAVRTASNKRLLRERLRAAGVPTPDARTFALDEPPGEIAAVVRDELRFPVVVKPLVLSASRGVIRADDEAQLAAAVTRVAAILEARPEFHPRAGDEAPPDPDYHRVLVEPFVPGGEVAVEAILERGELRVLALFDKPDPLDGPFFEETIYVTPSREPRPVQAAIVAATARAAHALGLREGPIHAELRLPRAERGEPPRAPVVLEVAARSIGGLCARTLRFALGGAPEAGRGQAASAPDHALEELVLARALSLPVGPPSLDVRAAGVMMLPVPCAGVLVAVDGVDAARAVPLVEDVAITARVGDRLVPLPEGASYPGFVFARGDDPAAVERALREARARITFTLARTL